MKILIILAVFMLLSVCALTACGGNTVDSAPAPATESAQSGDDEIIIMQKDMNDTLEIAINTRYDNTKFVSFSVDDLEKITISKLGGYSSTYPNNDQFYEVDFYLTSDAAEKSDADLPHTRADNAVDISVNGHKFEYFSNMDQIFKNDKGNYQYHDGWTVLKLPNSEVSYIAIPLDNSIITREDVEKLFTK